MLRWAGRDAGTASWEALHPGWQLRLAFSLLLLLLLLLVPERQTGGCRLLVRPYRRQAPSEGKLARLGFCAGRQALGPGRYNRALKQL